jgi:dGTPase
MAAEQSTRSKYGAGNLTRYGATLEVPRSARVEVAFLKSISGFFIINAESSQQNYAHQRTFLKALVAKIYESAPGALEPDFLAHWESASSEGEKLRVVIDQVASFTDLGAIKKGEALGISLESVKD